MRYLGNLIIHIAADGTDRARKPAKACSSQESGRVLYVEDDRMHALEPHSLLHLGNMFSNFGLQLNSQ